MSLQVCDTSCKNFELEIVHQGLGLYGVLTSYKPSQNLVGTNQDLSSKHNLTMKLLSDEEGENANF